MRRVFVLVLTAASIASAQVKVTPQAKAIHDSAIVVDTHADTTQFFLDPNFDFDKPPIDLHPTWKKRSAETWAPNSFPSGSSRRSIPVYIPPDVGLIDGSTSRPANILTR